MLKCLLYRAIHKKWAPNFAIFTSHNLSNIIGFSKFVHYSHISLDTLPLPVGPIPPRSQLVVKYNQLKIHWNLQYK